MEKLEDSTINQMGQTSCQPRLGFVGLIASAAGISSNTWLVGAFYQVIFFEKRSLLIVVVIGP